MLNRDNIQINNTLGKTKSGKSIYRTPEMNVGFEKQDHLDAYRAHASFLMHNELGNFVTELHRMAMNEHYLQAVRME